MPSDWDAALFVRLECPAKVFYSLDKIYLNRNEDDSAQRPS